MGFRPEADLSPMPKLNRNALSAQMVRHAGPGSYVDGNGLMLRVRDSGSRSWVQRLMVALSGAVFGWEVWRIYVETTAPLQAQILETC